MLLAYPLSQREGFLKIIKGFRSREASSESPAPVNTGETPKNNNNFCSKTLMNASDVYILAIESSCDDTAAAVLQNEKVLSNVVAGQKIHEEYGGVVPELASRAHQQHIVPVVHRALARANIDKKALSAIAFTRGPGLLGSLLVGTSFAKSMAMGLQIPLIAVHHMQAHILAHFIAEEGFEKPPFPFLAMTVSGGHTQIVRVKDYFDMEIIAVSYTHLTLPTTSRV